MPKILTEEHKCKCVVCTLGFIIFYHGDRDASRLRMGCHALRTGKWSWLLEEFYFNQVRSAMLWTGEVDFHFGVGHGWFNGHVCGVHVCSHHCAHVGWESGLWSMCCRTVPSVISFVGNAGRLGWPWGRGLCKPRRNFRHKSSSSYKQNWLYNANTWTRREEDKRQNV